MGRPEEKILGVDPGLSVTGYALIRRSGQEIEALDSGVVRTDSAASLEERLHQLYLNFNQVLEKTKPSVIALEEFYSAYEHPKTAILMGHARGIVCLCAAMQGVRVVNYGVTEVKRAITGTGRASKEQVQRMVTALVNLSELPKPWDVADAFALALCHCNIEGRGTQLQQASGRRRR